MNAHPPTSQIRPALCAAQIRKTVYILSIIILAAALILPSISYALLKGLSTDARSFLWNVLYYAWAGVYLSVAWFSGVTGQFWILDIFRGRICGNKFMECRPWD